jgi:hypothetical protein
MVFREVQSKLTGTNHQEAAAHDETAVAGARCMLSAGSHRAFCALVLRVQLTIDSQRASAYYPRMMYLVTKSAAFCGAAVVRCC